MNKKFLLLASVLLLVGCNNQTSSSGSVSSNSSSLSSSTSSSTSTSTSSTQLDETTLYLVGDSTVCSFTDDYYFPRYGYGTQIGNYLSDKVTINNLALSGRSSKSFLLEENYQTLKDSIKKGDYLVIGFGHNDEKNEVARYTNPNTSVNSDGSFKKSLYDNYVKLALDKGATPILATPIVRYSPSNDYTGNNIHQTSTTDANFPGGDYSKAIIDLANEKDIAYIDLTTLTKNQWSKVGADQAKKYHAQLNKQEGSLDKTHINKYGANVVSYLFTSTLKNTNCSFKAYVKDEISFPSEATYYISNPDYVEPTYTVPTSSSTIFTDVTSPWMASVFGDCGGASKISKDYFDITQSGTTVNITAGKSSAAGKISSSSDGLAMCFQKIGKEQDFTLSATMLVNSYQTNKQVGFGLMIRDDMYIDTFNSAISSNYVASGVYDTTTNTTTSFSRNKATLSVGSSSATSLYQPNTSIDVSISRSGDTITTSVGTLTNTFTEFNLGSIDTDYDYVGMFASRQANITFTNVSLTLN